MKFLEAGHVQRDMIVPVLCAGPGQLPRKKRGWRSFRVLKACAGRGSGPANFAKAGFWEGTSRRGDFEAQEPAGLSMRRQPEKEWSETDSARWFEKLGIRANALAGPGGAW